MELWIRSQDKECLMKVDRIDIYDTNNNVIMANGFEIWLGAYKTKERALEVLDEIQNILQPKVIWREPKINTDFDENFIQTMARDMVIQTTQQVEYDLKQAGQIVYEMPEK